MKTSEPRRATSIRGRLLAYLLLPLLLLMALGVWTDHRTLVTPVYSAFDRMLTRSALAIAAHAQQQPDGDLDVHWPAPFHAHYPPHFRPRDMFLFRVSSLDGRTLAGTPDLPQAPLGRDDRGYADVLYRGAPLRVASLRARSGGEPSIVTAAETTFWRNHVVHRLDMTIGISDSLQLLLVLAIAMFGITVALRPLQSLRRQIVEQPPDALKPLPPDPVPGEVRPLVDALNGMLATVRESAQAQQHFLTNAAHQLRTPLSGLKAQLEVLECESADAPQQARIAALRDSIDRLAHTANQLLALARAEPSARRISDFVPLQLPALVGAVVTTMLERALARDIDLGADCQPVEVQGVYWLLHESLANLIDNAIRHTPAGGQITVRCGMDGDAPFLEVEDDGPGIPLAERERVRERFYRHGPCHGSGLGLAIVEEVARSHYARLHILDGAGGGARMRIQFPAAHPSGL